MQLTAIELGRKRFEVLHIDELVEIPEEPSGIIFDNGMYIRCGFAQHLACYNAGAMVYNLSVTDPKELERITDANGVCQIKEAKSLFRLLQEDEGKLTGNPVFIEAKATEYEGHAVFERLAQAWLAEYEGVINVIRALVYMVEDPVAFWEEDDNDPEFWNKMFLENAGIPLISKKVLAQTTLETLPYLLEGLEDYFEDVNIETVRKRYTTMRRLAGMRPYATWYDSWYLHYMVEE